MDLGMIKKLSEEQLKEAYDLLDYGPKNRIGLLHFCLQNHVITEDQYQIVLSIYPLVVSQNPNLKWIAFYNQFLDGIGLTKEVYQIYRNKKIPRWKVKAMEEYIVERKQEGFYDSIEQILSDRDSKVSFDMWYLLSIRPFDIEVVCNENGYCYYVLSVLDCLDFVLDYEFFEKKYGLILKSIGEANHILFDWLIKKIPELQGKVRFDTSEGIVFTLFAGNVKEEELDYSNDCFDSEICNIVGDDLNLIKEIGFYVSRLYSVLEKEYEVK